VQVQQGTAAAAKLSPGEQVATNPVMQSVPVLQEIAWSRNAAAHLALLEQTVSLVQLSVTPTVSTQTPAQAGDSFEVASVRQLDPLAAGGRGLPGSGVSTGPCVGGGPQLDPRRFAVSGKTIYYVITAAYGMGSCLTTFDRIAGGPGWMKSELW